MARSSLHKSTTVRTITVSVRTAAFRFADLVAPGLAASWAYRMWFRLPSAPPAGRPAAIANGEGILELLGSPFTVTLRGRSIRGWTWGEGPVVYLVHGWAGSGEQLVPLVRPLLAQGVKVVAFDGLSHGHSDAGVNGPKSSDAVELGRSLDAVAARFGPARAIIAHSLGALAAVLALRHGWVSTERLVLVAPVEGVPDFMSRFRSLLGFGRRTEARLEALAERRTGYPVADLDVALIGEALEHRPELLVIHDLGDRETSHAGSASLVRGWSGAQLYSTSGLGHNRVLADAAVGGAIARFTARLPVDLPLHAGERPLALADSVLVRSSARNQVA